jgi:hypothetical protein
MSVTRSSVKSLLQDVAISPGICGYIRENDHLYAIMKDVEKRLFSAQHYTFIYVFTQVKSHIVVNTLVVVKHSGIPAVLLDIGEHILANDHTSVKTPHVRKRLLDGRRSPHTCERTILIGNQILI